MNKKAFRTVLLITTLFVLLKAGLCLDGQDPITLKKAGISDETIQVMVEEKTIETCAFTVQEIVAFKKAGLSGETIRMLIREGSFIKDSEPVFYGKDIRSIKFTTAKDIVELKRSGMSDEVIQAIIVFGSKNVSDVERENAWEMLKNMGIILDMREGNGRGKER